MMCGFRRESKAIKLWTLIDIYNNEEMKISFGPFGH